MKLLVNRISFFFDFLWLLLITLNSYYFYNLGLPLFAVMGSFLALILIFFKNVALTKNDNSTLKFFIFIFIWSIASSVFNNAYLFEKRLLLVFTILPTIVYSAYLLKNNGYRVFRIIKFVIIVHLVFFYLQFASYYIFGYFIDYLYPITGESQRAMGGSYSLFSGKLIRATGLFNEPGTYSTYTFLLFLIYRYFKTKFFVSNKLEKFDYLVLLSVFLTFSVFGMIFNMIFITSFFLKENLTRKIKVLIISLPVVFVVFTNYILVRFTGSNNGLDFRGEIIDYYFDTILLNDFHTLFGYSIFIDLNSFFNVSFSWNDVGLGFNFLLSFGIVGCLFILLFILNKTSRKKYLFLLILFLSKLSITTIFLWFCFAFIFTNENDKSFFNNRFLRRS